MNRLYYRFTVIPFLKKSYTLKFLVVSFLGIHVPLILFASLFLTHIANISSGVIFLVLLGATLAATSVTITVQNRLLYPIRQAWEMLNNYILEKKLPGEVINSDDEVGRLITQIHSTIYGIDKLLQEKEDIGALLSHDLRVPVSQIVMLTQSIRKEQMSPELAGQIKMIHKIANDQLNFIGEMLLLFKTDKGGSGQTELVPVNLYDLVERILNTTMVSAVQKSLNIFNNVPSTVFVYAQKELLKQAIQNLVANSIKFSNQDGNIFIDTSDCPNLVHINIRDEGIGFTSEERGRLFSLKPVRKEGTLGEKSNGFGLYLVRKIAEKHNGHIMASSNGLNKGATFSLLLPFQPMTA